MATVELEIPNWSERPLVVFDASSPKGAAFSLVCNSANTIEDQRAKWEIFYAQARRVNMIHEWGNGKSILSDPVVDAADLPLVRIAVGFQLGILHPDVLVALDLSDSQYARGNGETIVNPFCDLAIDFHREVFEHRRLRKQTIDQVSSSADGLSVHLRTAVQHLGNELAKDNKRLARKEEETMGRIIYDLYDFAELVGEQLRAQDHVPHSYWGPPASKIYSLGH